MAGRIVWSRTALGDLRSLTRYISQDSPHRAESFGYRIVARVEMLLEHPRLGRKVPEFNQEHLREVTVPPYRVVYRLTGDSESIEILRIWHAARDTPEIE